MLGNLYDEVRGSLEELWMACTNIPLNQSPGFYDSKNSAYNLCEFGSGLLPHQAPTWEHSPLNIFK